MDETTQQLIDGLISFIWHTEEKSSVTNLMVARILDWLNRRAAYLEGEIRKGNTRHEKDLAEVWTQIAKLRDFLKGTNTLAGSAYDNSQTNAGNITTLAAYINAIIKFLETGESPPEGWHGGFIEGAPGAPGTPGQNSPDVDRGEWYDGDRYYSVDINPATGEIEVSYVWYKGCKFRCLKTGTTDAPLWNSEDWQFVEGDPAFHASFEETEQVFDPDTIDATLTVRATLYNQDVTADLAGVEWSRYSEDDKGAERTLSDQAWTAAHAMSGTQIRITGGDCGFLGYIPAALRFSALVTLRVPGHQTFTEELEFGY